MTKTSIAKALKLKNRAVGEVNRLKVLINRENVKKEGIERKYDVSALVDEMKSKLSSLISLKTAICKANINIYQKITEMEECKSMITHLSTFVCDVRETYTYDGKEQKTVKMVPALDEVWRDKEIMSLQKRVEELQDEIDEYNATHYIEL